MRPIVKGVPTCDGKTRSKFCHALPSFNLSVCCLIRCFLISFTKETGKGIVRREFAVLGSLNCQLPPFLFQTTTRLISTVFLSKETSCHFKPIASLVRQPETSKKLKRAASRSLREAFKKLIASVFVKTTISLFIN